MITLFADNLTKKYKNKQVLFNISLAVKSGEIIGLLGPNGAGKTTTFYILVGLIKCDSGRILIGNNDISFLPLHARACCGISYLPQESSIFQGLSVYDNLMAVLQIRHDLNNYQRKNRIYELMKEFNIEYLSKNLGKSLSGGERRRVEIARALASEPKFILLDEPFAGIDPISVVDIKNIIKYLSHKKNIGILITDHNVRETLSVCHHAYIVNQGHLISYGAPDDIIHNYEVKNVYLGKNFKL